MAEKKKPTQGSNKLQIRNSTVDFLVFSRDAHEEGIEVRVQNHDVWLTQKAIGELFDVDRSVVTKHLKNIFESGELDENSVCAKFAQTADDGKLTNINSTPCLPSLPLATASIPTEHAVPAVGNKGTEYLYQAGVCTGQKQTDQRTDF